MPHSRPLTNLAETCAIELQAQGHVPQLASWQEIGIEALRIAHRCAHRHQQGYAFIGESKMHRPSYKPSECLQQL